MFAVEAGGRRAYTREGAFHFVPDPGVPGSMVLVNNQGYFVLNDKNQHIRVSDKAKVAIDPQGKVLVDRGGAITTAGTLKVLKPLREDELQQMDGNLFVVPASLNENQVFEVPQQEACRRIRRSVPGISNNPTWITWAKLPI